MLVTLGICFKQHFDTRYLVFYNPSPPRMFLSLDLLSEYRIQHGAIGPLYVTSSYSTWIFCRGVSGFATDCPCDVWCRGLTICLLHVGPSFGNRILNTSWAVGLTYWILYLHFFCILTYAIIYVLIHHIIFGFVFTSEIFFIFSSTPVLTSSIDVVFVLSIGQGECTMKGSYCNIKVHTIAFTISYFCLCSMILYAIRVFHFCVKCEVKAASMVHESCLTGFISKPLLPQIFIDLSFHIYNTEIAFRIVCNLS